MSTPLLVDALSEAQRLGFIGSRPVAEVIEHARRFTAALTPVEGTVLDLGSGGGVPGLVIAADRPDLQITLLDRREKRTDFLERMVRRLGWSERVQVITGNAEHLSFPEQFQAVVARGFGPPERTLRIALRFLDAGGMVVISEPPTGDRWPPQLLAALDVQLSASVPGVACFRRHRAAEVPRETS